MPCVIYKEVIQTFLRQIVRLPLIGALFVFLFCDLSPARAALLQTAKGHISYDLQGQGSDTLVFVPGFSIPSLIYKNQSSLQEKFRVLSFDLYGRGLSDRPPPPYDAELFVTQLETLLDGLHIREPIHLVGQSMGGAIAMLYANRHPERIKTLTLLCPAGIHRESTLSEKLVVLPSIGDLIWALLGKRYLAENFSKNFKGKAPEDLKQAYMNQLEDKAVLRAIHSTLRHFPLQNLEAEWRIWGKKAKPTLILWGTEDQILPFAMSQKLKALIPGAQFVSVKGAGHSLSIENASVVNGSIEAFARSHNH